jgi:DNA-binding transcriptional MerR regulator/methylmalonyl-CoA mutase cobalamin-binding subunit
MAEKAAARHPIRVVAQRTGLTPATIRAWERRYDAVAPTRSEGGQRVYTDLDVQRLRTLKALTDAGRGISMVADLSPMEADALLTEDLSTPVLQKTGGLVAPPARVDEAYEYVRALDGEGLARCLWRALVTYGARPFLSRVADPLIQRIGEGWQNGDISPAHEHLASEVIEQLLDRLVDRVRPPQAPTLVASTLPGERHGLGALLASAAATLDGWSVVYLGTDLPVEDIAMAAVTLGADGVAISVVRRIDAMASANALSDLRRLLDPRLLLFVGGGGLAEIPPSVLPAGLIQIIGLEGFASHLPGFRS